MSSIAGLVVVCALLGFFVGTPIYAHLTNPQADRAAIKAAYEGLVGRAGPNAKVVDIRRSLGHRRYKPGRHTVYRRYEIRLERNNGAQLSKTVGVQVGLFGGGSVAEVL